MSNISFIIPTYNNRKLLVRSINSIESQMSSNDNIIVIDDGSTDGTFEYIDKKYKKNSNIAVVKQVNSGSGVARNKGISISQADYIWFVDSDDYIVPDSVSSVRSYLNQDIDILFFDYYLNEAKDNTRQDINIDTNDKISMMLSVQVPWNKVFKRSLFRDVKFPEEKIRYQDHGTIPLLISQGKKIEYLQRPLYVYDFTHPNNISKNRKKNNDIYKAFENLLLYSEKGFLTDDELEVLFINTFIFSQIYNSPSDDFAAVYSNITFVKEYMHRKYPEWKFSKCLNLAFSKKYSEIIPNLKVKIVIGNILKKNNYLPALLVYLFKVLRNLI